jgi:hypothetical protein
MRLREIHMWAERHDPRWINRGVTFVVVPLDVSEIDSAAHIGPLIEIARIGKKIGVLGQSSQVALEMSGVDRNETY